MKKDTPGTLPTPPNEYVQNAAILQQSEMFNLQVTAKIKTSLTAKYYPKHYEQNTQPSKTVPDQTMSLKTILDRYARGIPVNNAKTPIYENDENALGIDIRSLDLAEKEAILDSTRENIKNLQNKLQAQQAPKTPPVIPTPTPTPEKPATGL